MKSQDDHKFRKINQTLSKLCNVALFHYRQLLVIYQTNENLLRRDFQH